VLHSILRNTAKNRMPRNRCEAGVLEIVDDYDGDTYRAVYTVQLVRAVYVLHAFQKKSKTGSKLPQRDAELIKERLRMAEALDRSLAGQTFSKESGHG
jgi:phage-related protein